MAGAAKEAPCMHGAAMVVHGWKGWSLDHGCLEGTQMLTQTPRAGSSAQLLSKVRLQGLKDVTWYGIQGCIRVNGLLMLDIFRLWKGLCST